MMRTSSKFTTASKFTTTAVSFSHLAAQWKTLSTSSRSTQISFMTVSGEGKVKRGGEGYLPVDMTANS